MHEDYGVRRYKVGSNSPLRDLSIRDSGIREKYNSIVVGLERNGLKTKSPSPQTLIHEGDLLWVVGDLGRLTALSLVISKNE